MDVILGTAGFGYKTTSGLACTSDKAVIQGILDEFKKHGYKNIDTARGYSLGTTESILAEVDYNKQGFYVDTKIISVGPGCHTAVNIAKSIEESLSALQTTKVRVVYLHHPDTLTPYEETLAAINEAYKKGQFEQFGISNYTAEQVERLVQTAREHGWVQPTVYQGLYNLVARAGEKELFPVLRKYGIKFYAFSILGGSFLTEGINKDHSAGPNTRFDPDTRIGQAYRGLFFKDSHFKALEILKEVAQKHGLTIPEIAVRWIMHHSALKPEYGDAIITGGSKLQNVKLNFDYVAKPPLPQDVVKVTEEVWNLVSDEAQLYYVN